MSSSSPPSSSPFTFPLPTKAPPAPSVAMAISPTKSTNICPKEKCAVHVPKIDKDELKDLMGRLSLNDGKEGKDEMSVMASPRKLEDPFLRRPKVKFHFVRHAQAIHNIRSIKSATSLRDTNLTPHGRSQARAIESTFHSTSKIKYMLCSPLRRTINTALLGFPSVLSRGVQCLLWEDLREFGMAQCNTGSTLLKLRENIREIGDGVVNTELLYGGWEWLNEQGSGARAERTERVKRELKDLEEVVVRGGTWKGIVFLPHWGEEDVEVVVVSHGSFLCRLMGYPKQNWINAEWRTFKFPSATKVAAGYYEPLELIQTKSSLAKTHTPIPETGPPFHMVIDDSTFSRLVEIKEFTDHVEMMKRKAKEGEERAFGEFFGGKE